MPHSPLHLPILSWYDEHARDLPWRAAGTSAWAVLVSEVMLQQTPVSRVEPVYREWLRRWPDPAALAAEPAGAAVRAWGRLGYPRRALRLHAAAAVVVAAHDGEVPTSYHGLRALPGVGDYTAAAVASFAHGARHAVLDTNVRRVLARTLEGVALPRPSVTAGERLRAEAALPDEPAVAARWAVAVMELGALVCTARAPRCGACPVAELCAWRASDFPAYDGPRRPAQPFTGTDRQARGRLLAVLRDRVAAAGPVGAAELAAAWPADAQRARALAGLLADGLVVASSDSGDSGDSGTRFRLP